MAGKKMVRDCFGAPNLIKKLEEDCSWIDWISGKIFSGFEFNECRLHLKKRVFMDSKCRITITDVKTGKEFSIEGFCDSSLLVDFSNPQWKPIRLAKYDMNYDPIGGRSPHHYKVFLEVLKEEKEKTS